MKDSGYIVEHYTMIHSKWPEENPVYGQRCSSIRINGSVGFWLSANCSEMLPYICMNEQDQFVLPGLTTAASTSTMISLESPQTTNDIFRKTTELKGKQT